MLGVVPTTNVVDFRQKIREFVKRQGRQIAEKLFLFLVYDHPQYAAGLDQYLDQNVAVLGKWAGYFEITLSALYFGIDIVCFINTAPTIWKFGAREFLSGRHMLMPGVIPGKAPEAYIYLHQFKRPLTPAAPQSLFTLNHFLCLILVVPNVYRVVLAQPVLATICKWSWKPEWTGWGCADFKTKIRSNKNTNSGRSESIWMHSEAFWCRWQIHQH